jgi:molecular chaperone GrpE
MNEHHIQRFDALGQAFDAETMNAIGTVESHEYPAGHVAEQLSPSYRWRENLLRFAEVRVVS